MKWMLANCFHNKFSMFFLTVDANNSARRRPGLRWVFQAPKVTNRLFIGTTSISTTSIFSPQQRFEFDQSESEILIVPPDAIHKLHHFMHKEQKFPMLSVLPKNNISKPNCLKILQINARGS
jgi:hypothetical protein